jgi:hypothetical protein
MLVSGIRIDFLAPSLVVRERLFPIGTFALGAGKSRYNVLEKIRWTVVSLVASLLLLVPSYLTSRATGPAAPTAEHGR